MKNVIPVVMAGVIGIYGLIVAVILAGNIPMPQVGTRVNVYSIYTGMAHLAAGLCCGLSGLAAGGCIGIVGDYGVRSVGYRTSNISVVFSHGDKGGGGGGWIPRRMVAEAGRAMRTSCSWACSSCSSSQRRWRYSE